MNQENKLELTQKIHQLQAMGKDLANLEHQEKNYEAGNIARLLAIMAELFTEVDQRLTALEKKREKPNFFLACKQCQTLWNIIGTIPKLKGRLLINPSTSLCYLCEKGAGLPPVLANLWEFSELKKQWKKVEITN